MEGLEWNLRLYTEGSCPDYRWTYDACTPTAPQLVAELDSAARLVKADKDLPQSGAERILVRLHPSITACVAEACIGARPMLVTPSIPVLSIAARWQSTW